LTAPAPNDPIDRLIAAIAYKQQGNIARRQLIELGLDDNAIKYRLRTGRLYRVYPGVYAVGRPPSAPAEKASAAVLACGEGAGLSGLSAGALWGVWPHWPATPEVIVPRDRRPRGISTHRVVLLNTDLRHHLGIRVTSPPRMLLDCAPSLTDGQLKRLVNNARINKWTRITDDQIADIVARNPRHKGAKLLRWFIEEDAGHTSESPLEDILYPWCDRYGLQRPLTQILLGGFRVDALYADEKVILELDGWKVHRGRESFESDRDRDATLLAAGFVVIRTTWRRLEEQPEREAQRLKKILADRRRALAA
jgi:very-short-patch-repair endonuclease